MNIISASYNPLPVETCWNTNLFKSTPLAPRFVKIEAEHRGGAGHAYEFCEHPR